MRAGIATVVFFALFSATAVGAEVARLSIEITGKGNLTVVAEPVADEEFEPAAGKAADVFGVPGAEAKNDDGFVVISHAFRNAGDVAAFGEGLRWEDSLLVADTGAAKDDIGPRIGFRHPRRFGLPFSLEMDVVRQGSINKKQASQAGRSLNFNFSLGANTEQASHLFVSFQATDTRYANGLIYVTWKRPGDAMLRELGTATIKGGKGRFSRALPKFPEDVHLNWWTVVRGDNAHIRRVRCAGPLKPAFGFELAGSAGQVTVKSVATHSPAAKAGIQPGDRLISVGDERIRDVSTALEQLALCPLFGSVKVGIRRGEESREVVLEGR